jgi:hypothetical protein
VVQDGAAVIHLLMSDPDLCMIALVGSVWLNAVLAVLLYLARRELRD